MQTARAPTQRLAGTNPKTGPSDRYTLSQLNTPASRSHQPQLRLSSSPTTWTEKFVGLLLGVHGWLHWIRVCFLVVALGSGIMYYLPIPFYFIPLSPFGPSRFPCSLSLRQRGSLAAERQIVKQIVDVPVCAERQMDISASSHR